MQSVTQATGCCVERNGVSFTAANAITDTRTTVAVTVSCVRETSRDPFSVSDLRPSCVDKSTYEHEVSTPSIRRISPMCNRVSGVQITNVLPSTYGRFVMPLEAQLLEPDISQLLEAPPRLFPPVYFDYNNEDDTDLDAYAFAMQAGRPVGVR